MKQPSAQDRQRINKSSTMLTTEENKLVFDLLGPRCQTMSTGVIQLYTTEPPAHSHWVKRSTGVACFVRDNNKKSYFIRVFCLLKSELVWEEEIYDQINIKRSRDYLIDFEGKDCLVALNFASGDEALAFSETAMSTVTKRTRRRQERKSRAGPPPVPDVSSASARSSNSNNDPEENTVVLRNNPHTAKINALQAFPQTTPLPSIPTTSKPKKRGARKITKADISMPTNFKHVTHVGWTEQKGFDLNGDDVENLNSFLKKAGVSDQQLNDRDTRAFIYDFIQTNHVLDTVKQETTDKPTTPSAPAPPPVPSRHTNGAQRTAPPPPPPPGVRQPQSKKVVVPPVTLPTRGPPPGRPPPVTTAENGAAPPPPPPPPPPPALESSAPPPPPMMMGGDSPAVVNRAPPPAASSGGAGDTRNELMESIRKGKALKHVEPSSAPAPIVGGSDSRGDLLSEIRQGVELRRASTREGGDDRASSGAYTDALADALRRALQDRGRVMRSSDSESDSENDNEWDD